MSDKPVGFIGKWIWPIILGAVCAVAYVIVASFAFSILQFLSTIPIINLILLCNMSIVGIGMIDAECAFAATMAVVLLINLGIFYDRHNFFKCKSHASWACGIILFLLYVGSAVIVFAVNGFSWQLLANSIPYILSTFFIIAMANE